MPLQYRYTQPSAHFPEEDRDALERLPYADYEREPSPEPDQEEKTPPPLRQQETIHVYPTTEGGLLFVPEELPPPLPPKDYALLLLLSACFMMLLEVIVFSLVLPVPTTEVSFSIRVPSFPLPPITQSAQVTARATGKGQRPATNATGLITFYNGALYTQIIPVGTMLTGTDGISVITDAEAAIPPAMQTTPPTYGRVSVPAHARVTGVSGNIPAGEINMACCMTSVIAQNLSSFTGGRNTQAFLFLTAQDVQRAVSPLVPRLQAQTLALFTTASMLDPTCSTTIQAHPRVGQQAERASITLFETCHVVSYSLQSVKTAITLSSKHLGRGTLSHVESQLVEVNGRTVTLYVTATWNPVGVRRYSTGK